MGVFKSMRDLQKQAKEIDRVLDEQEAADEDPTRPWWESDPTLSERFRRR